MVFDAVYKNKILPFTQGDTMSSKMDGVIVAEIFRIAWKFNFPLHRQDLYPFMQDRIGAKAASKTVYENFNMNDMFALPWIARYLFVSAL